ncbi:MAG: glutamate--cysteine ligase [Bradymonadia bacterium]|jgi:glutamate--cysteine ligase
MSRDQADNLALLREESQLRAPFISSCKGDDGPLLVGTEHEKFGYDRETLKPLAYEGERGIEALLLGLAERFDWEAVYAGGSINALVGPGGAVTLEPGGQLELSGAVRTNVHETAAELDQHLAEVKDVGASLGQVWCHFGMQPWESPTEIPWMPKPRYRVMRDYLPTRGTLPHWMMKTTATVQANYDFRSEEDAFDALRLMTGLGPVVTAMFANSPTWAGEMTSRACNRMHIWTDTDLDRSGVPGFFMDPDAGFAEMVQYALDVPMFFVAREGEYINLAGTSFRDFMAGEVEGVDATEGDWALHLSTIFPDVRMKGYLEVRQADAGPRDAILALPALWRGLLYDETSRSDARGWVQDLGAEEVRSGVHEAREHGLEGQWRGKSLRHWANELMELSCSGLDRLMPGDSEARYLSALRDEAGRPYAPYEQFRALWEQHSGDRRAMIAAYEIR